MKGEHENEEWGSLWEVLFWVSMVILNMVALLYSFWRFAGKHTDSTGTPVVIVQKRGVSAEDGSDTASATGILGGGARRRVATF